jgi:hypothetical protein
MLIEFKVKNFRSFKEEQTFSLVASGRDATHPDHLIPCGKFALLKSAAFYGANASGKSNLIKAIRVMERFIQTSATRMTEGDPIPGIQPFRLDVKSRNEPSFMEVTFIVNENRYQYGFSATRERVYDEWLVVFSPNKKPQKWFERSFDTATKKTKFIFRGPLEAESKLLEEKTRENGLVLSRGAELNIKPLQEVFLWFRKNLWVFDLSDRPMNLITETAKRVKEDIAFQDIVMQMMQHADIGIDRIKITEGSIRLENLPEELKQMFSEKGLQKFAPNWLSVRTFHKVLGAEVEEQFDMMKDESNGTQRLFALAGPLLDALRDSAIVVVDELECSMHPQLTRKLIELFQSSEANKKGAQLIFATHDITLMDPELFRRDQIWLVEKNQNSASEIFSLYDFATKERPRNTEAFQRNYLAGRYGGVPKFGAIFEDLELKQ